MSELKPIIVVKKGVASAADKGRLQKSGYIVLESDDLDAVRFLQPSITAQVSSDIVFHCAMSAIDNNGWSHAANKFGALLADALAKSSKP